MLLRIKVHLVIILSFFCANGFSQAYLSKTLVEKLESNSNEMIHVNLMLTDNVNLTQLKQGFNKNKTLVNERAKITLYHLRKQSSESQKQILTFLNENKGSISDLKSYWIVNMISLKATPDIIYQLQQRKDINEITTNEHFYFNHKPIIEKQNKNKGLEQAEPGIYAINAPAMWELGYSGRNKVVLGVDTGVKHKHPAIAEHFLGKYRPLNHAWFGYNNITPDDISFSSTHGTHTLGTVLGLDKATNDTVGIAWNSYWMAADPIVSDISDVRTLGRILESFEWALNPDGDFNTVSDIPDVITNSWGWDSFYSNEDCNTPETQAIDAAITAGIGVIFSAGNDGPGVSTIGQPANLAPGLLNVFSVGAVNGSSTTLPIADFSSRGPTTCVKETDGFSLWVKPEVVAPGVNVRSAMGDDEYGNLSGTSMAAPHVAGAFLLLKEAFPYLAGEDILAGLYYSAVDLGEDGEDNTFGKGIIDVKAAYDYLSQENTPVPPVENTYDIAISEVMNQPKTITFNNTISFDAVIKNKGLEPVQGINLSIQVNNNTPLNFSNNDVVNSGETITVNLIDIPITEGTNQVKVYCDLTIDSEESDLLNNTTYFQVHKPREVSLPYNENFDTTNFIFNNSLFTILNHNNDWTWAVDTAGGLPESTSSMRLDFAKMKSRADQYDDLISPLLDIPTTEEKISFWFKYAYAARVSSLFKDSLIVSVSTDLGISWKDTLFHEGDEGLATVDFNSGSNRFVPESEDEWSQLKFDLSEYKGMQILIRYRGVNDNGSNLYIDDIKLFEGEFPVSINKPVSKNSFKLTAYPNPANNEVTVNFNETIDSGIVTFLNSIGKQVSAYTINSNIQNLKIDISKYPEGIYFISFTSKEKFESIKLIKH